MELSTQVCSLDLAKRLRELGAYKLSKSLWVWEFADGVPSNLNAAAGSGSNVYAYSVAELGEIIRRATSTAFDYGIVMYDSADNGHRAWLASVHDDEYPWTFPDESTFIETSEADARAKMFIYLLENELLELGSRQ